MTFLMRLLFTFFLLPPCVGLSDVVQIAGPKGPLEAERISVENASDIVVIVPGSGPIDRDGNAPQVGLSTDTYKLLAEGLAKFGMASIRIDKRGMFGSSQAIADANNATIEAYAQDVRNWITFAAAEAECTWIAGHSEGGLVALVAAQSPPENLCGLILLATPGRSIAELMIEQLEANPANAPLMPELRAIVSDLRTGQTRETSDINPALRTIFSENLQRYMIDLFAYDPAETAKAWQGPTMIVQGDNDIQVRMNDADMLEMAMPQAQRLDLTGATHMLKQAVSQAPLATYSDPMLPLHNLLVPSIAAYISGRSNRQ